MAAGILRSFKNPSPCRARDSASSAARASAAKESSAEIRAAARTAEFPLQIMLAPTSDVSAIARLQSAFYMVNVENHARAFSFVLDLSLGVAYLRAIVGCGAGETDLLGM